MLFKVTICTKTLYNYIDSGLFLNISNKDLPIKRHGKKRDYKPIRRVSLNNIKGRSIEERPPEAENRKEAGHWEMDCVVGSGKACLLVMTERKSRKELIFPLAAKTQACVLGCAPKASNMIYYSNEATRRTPNPPMPKVRRNRKTDECWI